MTTDQPQRITRSYTMTIHAGMDKVFPLLCPVREHEYLDNWQATILYSESGVAEPGCVFETPNDTGPPTTWYIAEHDPTAGHILFVMFTPELHVSQLNVRVRPSGDAITEVTFTYTHTAIAPAGRELVAAFIEEAFVAKMASFERSISDYLETQPG